MATADVKEECISLETKRWGRLIIDEKELITFERGIPGFAQLHKFAIFEAEDIKPFQWLISIEKPEIGFVIISPTIFCPDYQPKLYQSDLVELNTDPTDQLTLFAIVTLAPNPAKSTANLQGPLLINLNKRTGKQVVVADENYSIKHPILPSEDNGSNKQKP